MSWGSCVWVLRSAYSCYRRSRLPVWLRASLRETIAMADNDELDLAPILVGLLSAMTDMNAGTLAMARSIPVTVENQEMLGRAVAKLTEAEDKLDMVTDLLRGAEET